MMHGSSGWSPIGDGAQQEWDRKSPSNFQYHANAATNYPPTENWREASRHRNAPPRLRGRGWETMNAGGCLGDDGKLGLSPMVGVEMKSSASGCSGKSPRLLKPSPSDLQLEPGRTRDGNLMGRQATDIHEGMRWRFSAPWAPSGEYDADVAKANRNRSALGTTTQASLGDSDVTDVHDGRLPRGRSIPRAPDESYGVGGLPRQLPHMRSSLDAVAYGRDIDGSGSGGAIPWAAEGRLRTMETGWSRERRNTDIHRGVGEPEGSSSRMIPVGHEQCAGRRLQQVLR